MHGKTRKPRALLILPYEPAAFMRTDTAILGRHFDLPALVHNRGKKQLFLNVLRHLLLRRPRVLFMWFIVPSYALAVTIMAKLLGVKVVFFTGGYDIVGMPDIGFGAMRFPLFRLMLKPTLKLADLTLPFSLTSKETLRKYAHPKRCRVLYPGVDTDFFSFDPGVERQPTAVTVSPVTESSIRQKGLRTFVEAARYAPDVRFVLVGRSPDGSIASLRKLAAPNVEFVERFLAPEELRDLFAGASCYVQVSLHEGFGIAVAEAMACGAVPVVTKVFSLPEVVGDLGEYVPVDSPQATASAVRDSLRYSDSAREAMRRRIVENYTVGRRERELVRLLRQVL